MKWSTHSGNISVVLVKASTRKEVITGDFVTINTKDSPYNYDVMIHTQMTRYIVENVDSVKIDKEFYEILKGLKIRHPNEIGVVLPIAPHKNCKVSIGINKQTGKAIVKVF